jgi:hypothetical protein
MTNKATDMGCVAARRRRADSAWLRLRLAITDEIIGKLPAVLEVDNIPNELGIPLADVHRAVQLGTIVTTTIAGKLHMISDASHSFLREQSRIRLPLPQSLRPPLPEESGPRGSASDASPSVDD